MSILQPVRRKPNWHGVRQENLILEKVGFPQTVGK